MANQKTSKPIETDFLTFFQKLEKAHQSGISCCIHLTTTNGDIGRVFFDEGEIIFLSYNNTRGTDVIPLLSKLDRLTFRISRFMPILKDRKLPDTPNILRKLLGQEVVSAKSLTSKPKSGLNSKQQQVIANILNDIAGPMSDFFVKDYVIGASSLSEVISNLSEELSDNDIDIFKSELEKRL